jgi:hypothetical protein
MKSFFKLLVILILPLAVRAQDTTIVKQQANALAKATLNNDYPTLIDLTYPKLVELAGGKDVMLKAIDEDMKILKEKKVL